MRIRWRGLELPSRVVRDENVSTDRYGRFTIEPFEQGFGTTIGNSLRRVLLSSLEGAAVTSVKLDGVEHEFTTIDGVVEDVTDILLNIKGVILSLDGEDSKTVTLERTTAGEALAGDLAVDPSIEILNPEHKIATLTSKVRFHAEMTVGKGRGYVTSTENRSPEQEISVIPIDSIFSPVLRVRYRTEEMRVGQRTNYDRLVMEIWTDGTIAPEDALVEAGLILRKHLNPLVMFHELGEDVVTPSMAAADGGSSRDSAMHALLARPVSGLNLSVRANNCLEAGSVATLGDLVLLSEADVLRLRSFGKTSLHEVQRKLSELGLSLSMTFDADGQASAPDEAAASAQSDEASADASGTHGVPASAGPMEAFTMGE